jgi:hypothetical protein
MKPESVSKSDLRFLRPTLASFNTESSEEIDAEERRRAIAAAGQFHSGASDISEKHDEYLVEAFQE